MNIYSVALGTNLCLLVPVPNYFPFAYTTPRNVIWNTFVHSELHMRIILKWTLYT